MPRACDPTGWTVRIRYATPCGVMLNRDALPAYSETDTTAAFAGVRGLRLAVLIPCHNEAVAIAKVVADFRASLPHARIYVYDNNSSDNTIAVARESGAIVRTEPLQGKGNVVRRMFADI